MKGIKVIFVVCLALLGVGNVWANESDDAVRAATRRGTTNISTASRQKSNTPATASNTNAISRITNATNRQTQPSRERTTTPRAKNNPSTVSRNTTVREVSPRATTSTTSRTVTTARTALPQSVTRATSAVRSATRTPIQPGPSAQKRASIARSSTNTEVATKLRDTIMNNNAKECREVYYNCMDEFCANKDSQLKRCACSARLHEFDNIKKQLENAEEKMLDFSQRLLTVSMDAKDAAALNVATEGELAFNQKDTSQSKKILDEITKKLNTKFEDDSFDRNLTAISLSLNEDAAFDNVDSLMGASTTLKTGTALYGAALPVCREMATEVCTQEQLSVAESGYQMMIEQDCNTVKKSYQSQTDTARAKVLENSALLDMSRLSTYQDKNSDDILTCKRKMLDMLSDTSVCGTDLTKCLDMTGQYIDPSTGEAFLTMNLANLSQLITRPSADQTWTEIPTNSEFVEHLNSKKKFLEPAMEHCQSIADSVWNSFIEDALAQIKLAQDAKLEQVRQSCTTLTTQCLSNTIKSLEDFDARALSTFGVIADKTVNAMCADVKNACTALMQTTGDNQTDWTGGMTEIATDTTYDTIIKTCREVGRACIIQACKSISGNFGLCENITAINRKSIINGTSCWEDVLNCVADAGADSIELIASQLASRNIIPGQENTTTISTTTPTYSFYSELYDTIYKGTTYPANASSVDSSAYSVNNCSVSGVSKPKVDENGYRLCKGDTGTSEVLCDAEHTEAVYEEENEYIRCVYDNCVAKAQCTSSTDTSIKCKTCRIAERIWGHCEMEPTTILRDAYSHNRIIKPSNNESTLLYWFAMNTGTENLNDSCRSSGCGPGEVAGPGGICYSRDQFTNDGQLCSTDKRFTTSNGGENCCINGTQDEWGNCCDSNTGMLVTLKLSSNQAYYLNSTDSGSDKKICIPKGSTANHIITFTPYNATDEQQHYIQETNWLICLGSIDNTDTETTDPTSPFPKGDTITCDGQYIIVTANGHYYSPDTPGTFVNMSYIPSENNVCNLQYGTSGWNLGANPMETGCTGTPISSTARYHIKY